MYSSKSTADTRVLDSPPAANKLKLYNLTSGGFAVGQFFAGFDNVTHTIEDPAATDVIDYTSNSSPYPTLSSTQTGLTIANGYEANHTFDVLKERTGWIKMNIGGSLKAVRVTEHNGVLNGGIGNEIRDFIPAYFIEILEISVFDYDVDYDWVKTYLGAIAASPDVTVNLNVVDDIDQQLFGESGNLNVVASQVVTSGEVSLAGGTLYLYVEARENSSAGTLLASDTDSVTTGGTLSASISVLDADIDVNDVYVKVELIESVPT